MPEGGDKWETIYGKNVPCSMKPVNFENETDSLSKNRSEDTDVVIASIHIVI